MAAMAIRLLSIYSCNPLERLRMKQVSRSKQARFVILQADGHIAFLFLAIFALQPTRLAAPAAGKATIQGIVRDASGPNIGGAMVTATKLGTQNTSIQKT